MLKLIINFDKNAEQPAQVRLVDTRNNYSQDVEGNVRNIRERVLAVLKEWQEQGHGDLKRFELDYYARYVEHEVIMKTVETKWSE